mmetsp:Transcript_25000/g.25211  ORF Transcript_25000/g.25211 Transcript_25000/m.25211 type:complete len:82 (+) Transcript_25000:587-832(+)
MLLSSSSEWHGLDAVLLSVSVEGVSFLLFACMTLPPKRYEENAEIAGITHERGSSKWDCLEPGVCSKKLSGDGIRSIVSPD